MQFPKVHPTKVAHTAICINKMPSMGMYATSCIAVGQCRQVWWAQALAEINKNCSPYRQGRAQLDMGRQAQVGMCRLQL